MRFTTLAEVIYGLEVPMPNVVGLVFITWALVATVAAVKVGPMWQLDQLLSMNNCMPCNCEADKSVGKPLPSLGLRSKGA